MRKNPNTPVGTVHRLAIDSQVLVATCWEITRCAASTSMSRPGTMGAALRLHDDQTAH